MGLDDPTLQQYLPTDRLLRANLEQYCDRLCWILDKHQRLRRLTWNRSQRYIHAKIERQKEQTGKVRAIILKARKLGASTYVNARFYHKTTLSPGEGQHTHIQTHSDDATKTLFEMVRRIHEHMSDDYRLRASAAGASGFAFGAVDSRYTLSTAGNIKGTGRGSTPHNLHCSELAFWAHANVHLAGIIAAVPDTRGTEIIFESTANGPAGVFYDQWLLAEKGESEYIPIFMPWWWDEENRMVLPEGFAPSEEEEDYGRLRKLDRQQVCWMHNKNINLGGVPGELCPEFKQEFPSDAEEAFQGSGTDPLIAPRFVVRAKQNDLDPEDYAARILGVDPGFGGPDRTRLIDRQGHRAGHLVNETFRDPDEMALANYIVRLIKIHEFDRVFIDAGVGGKAIAGRLHELGFSSIVTAVFFASKPTEPQLYINKRSEIWGNTRDWFRQPGGADIPPDDELHRELCGPNYKRDANGRLQLESKDKIRERLGFSPDGADALALTFTETVMKDILPKPSWRDKLIADEQDGGFMVQ